MKANPSFQFYPADWIREPGLRSCSLAARGLWIDMMCFLHEATPYGHLRLAGKDILPGVLARMVGSDQRTIEELLGELESVGVFSRTETGTIFSRRMVRDAEIRQKRAQGGVESLKHPRVPRRKNAEGYPSQGPSIDPLSNPPHDPSPLSLGGSPSSSSSSSSSSRLKNKEKRAVSASPSPAAGASRRLKLSDDEFIAQLRRNVAYKNIDIDAELGKIDAWLLTPNGSGKKKTRKRIFDWLNRASDRQREIGTIAPDMTVGCKEKIPTKNGRMFEKCGKPIDDKQPMPTLPFCGDHLPRRRQLQSQMEGGRS